MITAVLITHVLLAITISAGFILRYILAFKQKAYPSEGRTPLFFGSGLLVVSGVSLALLAKLPITSLCLESLGIISALIALELGLQFMSKKLASERIRINKK
jgi:hypothetical protein